MKNINLADHENRWIVIGIGDNPPTKVHENRPDAIEYAKRLSSLQPGKIFLVAGVTNYITTKIHVETLNDDYCIDYIPYSNI